MDCPIDDNNTMNKGANFWRIDVGMDVIPADTKNKRPIVEWKAFEKDGVSDELHQEWITKKMFDKGIAMFCGESTHALGKKGYYLNCIDLDNEQAIREFCNIRGKQRTLEELAENGHVLVEQHTDDKTKAHVYVWSKEPFKKKAATPVPTTSVMPRIEVKGKREDGLMFVTPSVHKNGTRYQLIGNYLKAINEPVLHDEIKFHVNDILDKHGIAYLFESDNTKKPVDGFFRFNPDEKIKVGSRHNFLIKYCNSLIRRLHETTPLDAIKIVIQYANSTYLEQPLPDKEIDQIFNDCSDFIGKQIKEEKSQDLNKFPEIVNNIHYQISKNPPKYIVAYKETKQVIEVTIRSIPKEKGQPDKHLFQNATYLACIPVKIARHKNPLAFLQTVEKYTISFVDAVGKKPTFSHMTLAEIVQSLRDKGYVLHDGVDKALNAMLQAFVEKNFIEENDEIGYTGFFPDKENNAIFTSNLEIRQPNTKELTAAINLLIELASFYNKRLDLLATSIVWGLVAPVMFVLKQNNHFLKLLQFYGSPNATKSNTGKIILALDGHQEDNKFTLNLSRFDSLARAGQALGHSTFPVLVDEMNLVDPRMQWLVEFLKSIVENQVSRSKYPSSRASGTIDIPALCLPILTGNPPPPINESAYMKRVISRYFPQSETMLDNDPKAVQFREFMRMNLGRLKALGDFRNWWIINNQREILDHKSPEPLELGLKILLGAFDFVNIQIPEWLVKERLTEDHLEESMEDNHVIVKSAFEKYIIEQIGRAIPIWRQQVKESEGEKLEIPDQTSNRLEKLAKSKLLPDIKSNAKNFAIIIRKGILPQLYNHGVTPKQLPNLKALADYMEADYKKTNGTMALSVDLARLTKYFDEENDDTED